MQLVSIAVCTYNGEKYLREQLDSLIHQTYQNLEIIVVDDRSSDRTMEILSVYAKEDKRIKIFQNEHNLGFVQNFSKALTLCAGDCIALADQDDIWKLDKIEIFLREIQEHTLIYSDAILIDQDGNSMNQLLIQPKKNLVAGHCNKAFLFNNCVSGNTLMFKKELLKFILPIPEISFHDTWIAFIASTIGTITYTNEAMTFYRRHETQITIKKVNKKSFNIFAILRRKASLRKESALNSLKDLTAYKNFIDKIDDPSITKILILLIKHYQNYQSAFISFELLQILQKYREELFAIFPAKKRLKKAKQASFGLRFHYMTLFLLA